jgi:hypothetical protein
VARKKRQSGPAGTLGVPVGTIPSTLVNGIPNPLIGVSVPLQFFSLPEVLAFEQAVGIKTNVVMAYQELSTSWPSGFATIKATGRVPMVTIEPVTAGINIAGGVRNSDSGIDSPMVLGTVYKGVVVSAITSLANNATQPSGSVLTLSNAQFVVTTEAMPLGFTGNLSTATFTATSGAVSATTATISDLAGVTAGTYDSILQAWAVNMGGTSIIRFAHEQNGNFSPWGIANGTGFTAAQYIAMWDHVWSVVQAAETAASLGHSAWLWCPNITDGGTWPFNSTFPGDSKCDAVGMDGYSTSAAGFPNYTSIFGADTATMEALTSKPIVIGETAVDNGTYNRATLTTSLFTYLEANPTVKGFTWFDHNIDLIDNDRVTCAAYKSGMLSWA